MKKTLVVAMTGASGAAYGIRLLEVLLSSDCEVHLTISSPAFHVIQQELGESVDVGGVGLDALRHNPDSSTTTGMGRLSYHHFTEITAPIASGSFQTDGMVVCPCSTGSLSAIAHGTCRNLIHRAADVHLKEKRPLILVPRETPLSLIHRDNMRYAAQAGATILPAMPAFYHGVETVDDLVDFVVARICDQLSVDNQLIGRWGGD